MFSSKIPHMDATSCTCRTLRTCRDDSLLAYFQLYKIGYVYVWAEIIRRGTEKKTCITVLHLHCKTFLHVLDVHTYRDLHNSYMFLFIKVTSVMVPKIKAIPESSDFQLFRLDSVNQTSHIRFKANPFNERVYLLKEGKQIFTFSSSYGSRKCFS